MKYLVKKGADINIKDNEGVSVWDCITDGRLVQNSFFIHLREGVLSTIPLLSWPKVDFVRVELLSF